MVQGYYTLAEAARILGMNQDKLSQMAQRREIRAFADRGTWRFRTQDVEEKARQLGMASSPDIQLGDAAKPKPSAKATTEDVFDFSLESEGTEHEIIIDSPSSSKIRPMGPTARPTTPRPTAKSPAPKPGSDSDVHLVFDVTDELPLMPDSDVKLESGGPKSGPKKGAPTGSDSGVRLVPMENDRGAPSRRPTPADSDIRLEPTDSQRRGITRVPAKSGDTTEEVNLDDAMGIAGRSPRPRQKTPAPKQRQSPRTPPPARKDSGDEDEVSLGDLEADDLSGVSSGINLHSPADSGINLAKPGGSDDSLEFELTLDQESTPRPRSGAEKKESSGEFELTLDDEGALAPLDEDKEKDIFETDFEMQALGDGSDSEAVSLEGQDTDLESSDFDLSLGDEESGSQVVALDEDEADEGAATAVARSRQRRGAADLEDAEELDDLLIEDEIEEEEEVAPRRGVVTTPAAPASWGALPAAVLAPTVVIMFIVGIMSFELLHSMWGYKQPYKATGLVTKTIAGLFGEKLPE